MTLPRRSLAAIITLASLGSATAWAGRDTLVYKFSSVGLDDDQADLPETFARAIAHELHAKVNIVTMDDAASQVGCDPGQRVCLEAMLGQTGANTIVFGGVTRNVTGKLKVVLTIYSTDDAKNEQSYVLSADSPDDAADELDEKADEQLHPEENVDPPPPTRIVDPPPPRGGGHHTTPGVSTGTYALIGVGAGATAVGIGFLVSASGIRNQIAAHATADRDDFTEIMELETRGKTRAFIGYGLAGAGVALGIYGIYRAMHEREPAKKHSDPADPADPGTDSELENALSIVPVQGGAAFTFSGTFR